MDRLTGLLLAALLPAAAEAQSAAPAASESNMPAPVTSEVLRQQAAALAAAGDYAGARAAIDRAQALAPGDNDIALARARILLWSGDRAAASAQAAAVRARAPGYPELAEVEAAIDAADRAVLPRSGAALTLGVADVDLAGGGSQSWESASLTFFGEAVPRLTLSASAEHERRRTSDTRLVVNLARQIGSGELRLGLSATPDADFREQWGLQAGADVALGAGVMLVSDIRYADYEGVTVTAFTPGLRLTSRDTRHSFTGRVIAIFRSDGDRRAGGSLRYDAMLDDALQLFAGAASYPDTEAGVTRQLRSLFAGGNWSLTPRTRVTLAAEYDRRAQSYRRKALVLSLVHRFGR